jgi:hypothetical protein
VQSRERVYTYKPLWAFVACSRVNFTFTLPADLMSSKALINAELEKISAGGRVEDLVRYGKVFSLGLTNFTDNLGHRFSEYVLYLKR